MTMVSRFRTSLLSQFAGFASVGAMATATHYVVLIGLVQLGRVSPLIATAIGAFVGAFVSYILNYRYVFRSKAGHMTSLPKFFAIAGIGLVLNSFFMWIFNTGLHLHYLLAQAIATGLVLVWSFSANRIWTFRHIHG